MTLYEACYLEIGEKIYHPRWGKGEVCYAWRFEVPNAPEIKNPAQLLSIKWETRRFKMLHEPNSDSLIDAERAIHVDAHTA
jgi:hypothetical protein